MKTKFIFALLLSMLALQTLPGHAQDFLKRVKPWLFPFDSLKERDAKQPPLPEPHRTGKRFEDRRMPQLANTSPALSGGESFSDSVQALWVRHYASGLISLEDRATAIAVDNAGNVYVTGYSESLDTYDDYATIKYNAAGVQEWEARYNGPGYSNDAATALAVDSAGNIYVTGYSWGSGTGLDYTTIKYNAAGALQWEARYDGPGGDHEIATALAVDAAGNVYVTGYSSFSSDFYDDDYATIKYNATGTQEWVIRYTEPRNSDDEATALAVDATGNVYVTGYSRGSGTSQGYTTIKYNTAGDQEWVTRYDRPRYSDDRATALAVDATGNVYVTGYSGSSDTYEDYATIKYNAAGDQVWVMRYNGPGNSVDIATAMAVDAAGDAYVTGSSTGSGIFQDYATIKYNAAGTQEWVMRYTGPGIYGGRATALALDATGNVYITGSSVGSGTGADYATIKYNATGTQEWVIRYTEPRNSDDEATALAVDATGNVYVTGYSRGSGTSQGYTTIKYNTAGDQEWVTRYDRPRYSDDRATALAVDATGNVYVTGYSESSDTYEDYATIKYNAAGDQVWVMRYNGPGNFDDMATAMAVDAAGNVYVTGSSTGSGTSSDYATIKYNAAGAQKWEARYNGPGNSSDRATALAVDATGNVYVTGYSWGSGTSSDYTTLKYNAAGELQWEARYNGLGLRFDHALAVDAAGNVYVTGSSLGSGTSDDYTTTKYNASGVEQWVARYNGPGNSIDIALALAVDTTGNVYVTGYSKGSGTSDDYATIKYNATGGQEWVMRYNGPGNSSDRAIALAMDAKGNVYVSGNSWSSGTSDDYATIKYNVAGGQEWVMRYNGPGNYHDRATALAVDAAGNVYVTGFSYGSGTSNDYYTLKYNASGVEKWVAHYNGSGYSDDHPKALAVDAAGNVYATGASTKRISQNDWSIYTTIKYSQIEGPTVVTNPAMNVGHTSATLNGMVNPNNLKTSLKFQFGTTSRYGVTVTATPDIVTGVGEMPVSANVSNLSPNRTYHYRLVAANYAITENGMNQSFTTTNQSPVMVNTIPDQNLTVARTALRRNLSLVFKDPDGDTLSYSVSSTLPSVAKAEISDSLLSVEPITSGKSLIIVVASDGYGGVDSLSFTVTVNSPPRIVRPLADIVLTINSDAFVRDLNTSPFVFADPDRDSLRFAASSSNDSIAVTRLDGSLLAVSPVAIGTAQVAVVADDNKGGVTSLGFTVTVKAPNAAPAIIPDSAFHAPRPENQPIALNVNITDNSGVVPEANFYYRQGGDSDFRKAELRSTTPGLYHGVIPKKEVTAFGVEYYFEAIDDGGLKARQPAAGAYSIQVKIAAPGLVKNEAQPGGSEKQAYRLISIPLDLEDKNPLSALREVLGDYDNKKWRLYAFDASQTPIEFPGFSEMKSGHAYWLILKESGKRISTGAGKTNRTDSAFAIPLHAGWNFVANPFNFTIPLSNVKLKVGNSTSPIDSSKMRTYLGHWNVTTDDREKITELKPFEGYAIFSDSSGVLSIDPDLSNITGQLAKSAIDTNEQGILWSVRVLAQCQEASDEDNLAAIVGNASHEWDDMDQPEPPPIGEYVSVYFPHREWNALVKTYCLDARPEPANGEVWEFEVKTNIRDKVNLSFENLASVPEEFEVWLVDETLQITQDLRASNHYALAGSGPEHPKKLKLIVGKKGFIESELADTQLVPTTFELSQNFPNPFNPVTTIRYGLPRNERVTLKLYNLLGAEVATLVNDEPKVAGYHTAIWDGRSHAGQVVSSGLYLYRMEAGSFTATRKLALIK